MYTKEQHRKDLIDIYNGYRDNDDSNYQYAIHFMFSLYEKAIQKLEDDYDPKEVEQWVIDMQALWSKLL